MLKGKTVILGITGSIAAYKMANVASMLKKLHCNVEVIMTKNAVNFINPITFETLTGNKCLIDTFDRNFQFQVEHISLAKRADLLMVAPASANIIGKLANGIADDMLTTTALACTCQKIIAPAMNTNMYLNPIVQDNMKRLQNYGFEMVEAASGHLACGDSGIGKLPEEKLLVEHIVRSIAREKDMKGMKVLVSAGATMEAIDPVRYITNHSTGKMGFALAKAAMLRGASVTVVKGHTEAEEPHFVKMVPVKSAQQMFEAVKEEAADEVPALLRVRVQVEHRGHPHGQLGLVGVGDEVLQLVAVSLGMAAGQRGQQLFAPLHAPLPECGIILHRYPPPRYRPAGCRST